MRLLDHFMVDGVTPPEAISSDGVQILGNYALEATVVLADNVTSYYYEGSDQEDWLWDQDFPNLVPPFKDMWIETVRPSKIVSEVNGEVSNKALAEKWGALLQTAVVKDKAEIVEFIEQTRKLSVESVSPDTSSAFEAWQTGEVKWIISSYLFAWLGASGVVGPTSVVMFPVRADGSILMSARGKPAILSRVYPSTGLLKLAEKDPDVLHMYMNECVNYLKPLMLAVCFMNCSNVSLEEFKHNRTVRRQLERSKSRTAGMQYKILRIEPMRKQARQAAEEAGVSGSRKSLHLVRGHFADYRKSGLFGKYKGIYWWDAHVRGTAEAGVVHKQYEVGAPGDGA